MKRAKKLALTAVGGLLVWGCNMITTRPSDLVTTTPSFPITPGVTATIVPSSTATPVPASPTITLTPTATLPGIGPDNFRGAYNPLTGLKVADKDLLEHRPLSVKINNYPRDNRPQWGLSRADIVWEYYHNNDLTRFHAIFYGQEALQIGPVRSGRLFDRYLVNMYKSIFVFAKADYRVMEEYGDSIWDERMIYFLEGDCPPEPVCRIDRAVHNFLVTNSYAPGDYVAAKGGNNERPKLDGMWFYGQVPANGEKANRFYLRYSYGAYLYWDYDAGTGKYVRYQDANEDIGGRGESYELLTDRLTGEAITADNVVVLYVPHFFYDYEPPKDGHAAVEVVDMNFYGTGPGIVFRDGYGYVVNWVWEDEDSLLYVEFENGERFPLKPGNTWYQVVNDTSSLDIDDDVWRVEFEWRKGN